MNLENLEKIPIVILLAVIALLSFFFGYYVRGSPASISESAFEHPTSDYSYFIFKDYLTYYATNGETGEIDYSGTSLTQVFSSVQNAMPDGGLISFAKGDYSGDITITKSHIRLKGESWKSTNFTGQITIDEELWGVTLEDFTVDRSGVANAIGIYAVSSVPSTPIHSFRRLHIANCEDKGIYVVKMSETRLEFVQFEKNGYGLYMDYCFHADLIECGFYDSSIAGAYFKSMNPNMEGGVFADYHIQPTEGELILDDCYPVKIEGVWFENQGSIPNINMTGKCNDVTLHGNHFSNKETAYMVGVYANGFSIKGCFAGLADGGSDHTVIRVLGNSWGEIGQISLGAGISGSNLYKKDSAARVICLQPWGITEKPLILDNVDFYLSNVGVNVSIPQGGTSQAITLPIEQPDTNYAVLVTATWNTSTWVTSKTTTNFVVNYDSAPAKAYIDYFVYRKP